MLLIGLNTKPCCRFFVPAARGATIGSCSIKEIDKSRCEKGMHIEAYRGCQILLNFNLYIRRVIHGRKKSKNASCVEIY